MTAKPLAVRRREDPGARGRETNVGRDWFDRLAASAALFSVDADQRVTRWADSCTGLLGGADGAIGRHCYEVVASMDLDNKAFCRPNCPVITAAKRSLPMPDFDIRLARGANVASAQVSVILTEADDESLQVLHLIRPAKPPAQNDGFRGNSLKPMLAIITGPQEADLEPAEALTSRQRAVLERLATGESVPEIAEHLGVSTTTVRNHIQAAIARLNVHSRLEAVLTAVNHGLL